MKTLHGISSKIMLTAYFVFASTYSNHLLIITKITPSECQKSLGIIFVKVVVKWVNHFQLA